MKMQQFYTNDETPLLVLFTALPPQQAIKLKQFPKRYPI